MRGHLQLHRRIFSDEMDSYSVLVRKDSIVTVEPIEGGAQIRTTAGWMISVTESYDEVKTMLIGSD